MWQFLNNKTLSPTQHETLKKEILTYYRSALKQRPSWPYTYSDFSVAKARFGEIDTEMQQALQTANKLGAREIDVLHITLELGMPLWSQLNKETRLTIAGAVDRSLTWQLSDRLNSRERIFALSLVGAYELQADICPLLTAESKKISNMCGS
jgi:hypothetical protein